MLCPFDCGVCREAECRGGCRLTGEPMLEVCYLCGEITTPVSRTIICMRCADDVPPGAQPQALRAG